MNRYNTTPSEGWASADRILRTVPIGSGYAVDTGKCVIGRAYVRPSPRVISRDAEHLQTALLEPRTAEPLPLVQRLAGALWRLA